MSDRCHVCGPVKHEAPTVICARCALSVKEPADLADRIVELQDAVRRLLRAGMCDHVNCEEGCESGDAWNALSALIARSDAG